MRHAPRVGLALLIGLVGAGLPRPAAAQAAADALRVSATSPNGSTTAPVTQAQIRFSEPMVPLADAALVDRVAYVHIEPEVPVGFRWADSSVLVVQPTSGRFPHASRITIRIDASAAAVSGRRLAGPVSFTFETPAPRLQIDVVQVMGAVESPTKLDLPFDQPVRADDAASRIRVSLEPPDKPLPALSARARAHLARVDSAALAAHDAWAREMRAAIGTPRPLAFTVARSPVSDARLEVVLATAPPPGGRVVLTVTGIGSPEGPLRRAMPERRVVSSGTLFALVERDCAGSCEPSAVALEPTHRVDPDVLRQALRVTDITRPSQPVPVTPGPGRYGDGTGGLEALGFAFAPGRRYAIRVEAGLTAEDGARLAAPWCAVVDVGLPSSFITLGSQGPAVWEASLGPRLPILTRSLADVRGGAVAVAPEAVVPALRDGARFGGRWKDAPPSPQTVTRVPGRPDGRVREVLVNVAAALSPAGTGLIWAAYPTGREARGASPVVTVRPVPYVTSALIQVTNIGLTTHGNASRLVILASRLDTGAPIAAADVTVLDEANRVLWHGPTDATGLADARPDGGTPFVVLARSAGDVAFVAAPYGFGHRPGPNRALAGVLFTDRALYRPGETAHVRAFVQEPRPEGLRPLPAGTPLILALEHEGTDLVTQGATLDAVGGAEWTVPIPESAKTDDGYRLVLRRQGEREYGAELHGVLLIKAFRPAEFRVDLAATSAIREAPPAIDASVTAHDLSEVALAGAPVSWTITRQHGGRLPDALQRDPDFAYAPFDGDVEEAFQSGATPPVRIDRTGVLDADGRHAIRAALPEGFVGRGNFTVAAQVRDASSQVIGRDLGALVPADVYLGVAADTSGLPAEAGVRIVARTPEGDLVPGIDVDVRVARARGPALIIQATTGPAPVRLVIPEPRASQEISVSARSAGRVVMPVSASFPFAAPSSSSWSPEAPALTMSLDQGRYAPGATARLRLASPWRDATALVTLGRGVIIHAQATRLIDGQAIVDLPVGASPTAGLLATVSLVRGRVAPCCAADAAGRAAGSAGDWGRPMSVSNTVLVPIDRSASALAVTLDVPAGFQAPGAKARVRVRVRDAAGRPAPARITLWAVDEGVLALTQYAVADASSMYDVDPSWSMTADSRHFLLGRIVPEMPWGMLQTSSAGRSLSVLAPQSLDGDPTVRRDLRPLAFWFGAIDTDEDGVAEVEPALPDTLTTYRVMAIAADTAGRYGKAETPLVAAKRLMVRPALPRVLTRDDRPRLRAIVAARDLAGDGTVLIESLTPDLLTIEARPQPIAVAPSARAIAAVDAVARATGTARIRVTATVRGVHDVVERDVPIIEATIRETSAAFGEALGQAAIETIQPPDGIDPTWGGLDLEVASTLLVGLAASGQYVHEYRYACAEQMASRALVLTLAPDLGPAFVAGLRVGDAVAAKAQAQAALDALARYRCAGRYGYWAGDCGITSPALTAYVLHVLQTAARRGLTVDAAARDEVVETLASFVAAPVPASPTYQDGAATRAFAVKVLADAGRRPARAIDAVYAVRTDLPVFALAHLMDAIHTVEPGSPRLAELRRMIANATGSAGATARIEERWRPEHAWLWPSSDKSTGIVLDVLTRTTSITLEEARPLVASLMEGRRHGIWAGTQGNVWALTGLATYRQAFEASGAAVTATASLGSAPLARHTLSPAEPTHTRAVPMPELRAIIPPGKQARLSVASSGPGAVFYATRLRWQRPAAAALSLDHGIAITRRYERLVAGTPHAAATTFVAGDLIRVTITVRVPESRNFVAVTDPLPAGFEAVDTTLAGAGHEAQAGETMPSPGWGYWRSGFDHLQRYDDRVDLFATSLAQGLHTVTYLARATTPGRFYAAPPTAEAMYEPEVAGRGAGATIVID